MRANALLWIMGSETPIARGASHHGVGDRSSNGRRPKKAARSLTPGAFFRGPGRYKPASGIPMNSCDEVPCQESPQKLDGSAARRDFPRRGCRMGGCPSYSRGGGMLQGDGPISPHESRLMKQALQLLVKVLPALDEMDDHEPVRMIKGVGHPVL